MIGRVASANIRGVSAEKIAVEVDLSRGLPCFNIVGLGDASIRESGFRIKSAMLNGGFQYPGHRITVNLVPAYSRKSGSHFDLPIAISILMASGQVKLQSRKDMAFFGELSLNGELTRVKGILPMVQRVAELGISTVVVPDSNRKEAMFVKGISVYSAKKLSDVVDAVEGRKSPETNSSQQEEAFSMYGGGLDYRDIVGQEDCKRALAIGSGGRHNILMEGMPGDGKTMLARRLPSIMPPMNYEERMEVTKVYSVAGLLNDEQPFLVNRPFRSPNHRITSPALLGGGLNPQPGEISLAHNGVLFIDEICEMLPGTMDCLRQPLEDRAVTIARRGGVVTFPGDVLFVAATNPCRCGYAGSEGDCTCSTSEIRRYRNRISGPILDRVDIYLNVNSDKAVASKILKGGEGMSSLVMREMVETAAQMQRKRFKGEDMNFNSQIPGSKLPAYCKLDSRGERAILEGYENLGLSIRGCHSAIRLARTIADMDERDNIDECHILEALQYRRRRDGW